MSKTVEQRVIKVVAYQISLQPKEVHREDAFVNDLGVDSLDAVEILMALEEEFDIEIPDKDAEKLKYVDNTIKYIEKKVDNK